MGGKESFEDFKTETTQSVFVGNHNFEDISFDCVVQNGLKAFSFEVKTLSNVCDDSVIWELTSKEFDLSHKVVFLRRSRDTTVAYFFSFVWDWFSCSLVSKGKYLVFIITVFSPNGFDGINFSCICPSVEGAIGDIEVFEDIFGSYEFFVIIHNLSSLLYKLICLNDIKINNKKKDF
jgi:hypothetical protein